jgi:xylulokinase
VYLGIDIGTSGVKAVICDGDGRIVASAQSPLTLSHPHPLWSEQQPEAWWDACCQAVRQLPAPQRAEIAAVGLAGQMHGAVLLDDRHRVLRPAILWNDGRSGAECRLLERRVTALRRITGNVAMPGFTAPKLLWVAAHEPAIMAAVAQVLLPKDYIRLRLTGDLASDCSDSAGTLWLDVGARRWSEEMLEACGLGLGQMPALHEGNGLTGKLSASAAAELGIPPVPVAAGAGDNAAAGISVGAINPGQGFLSLGTSGVIFAVSDGFAPNPAGGVHAFCHALPARWHQMAVILSAAAALDWACRMAGFADTATGIAAAEALPPDGDGPIFLPYLAGERTPHNNPDATAVLAGLRLAHGPAHIVRAALEGVALALADGADALRAAGTRLDRLYAVGGGARSRHWLRLVAAATGIRLDALADDAVGPALGAARLAQAALTGDTLCLGATPPLADEIHPEPDLVAHMAARRSCFRALQPAATGGTDRWELA